MKKNKYIALAGTALVLAAAATGCTDEREFGAAEGKVLLSATFSNDVKVASRATLEEELSESCIIWISNAGGAVRKYNGISSLPAEGIKLVAGQYVAEAWAGDSVSASFDKRYFKGRAPFTVTAGTTHVELPCRIANVVASVTYDSDVDDVLKDYTFTIGHSRGTLTFEGRDDRKGYFMMPSTDTSLTWTLTGKQLDGSTYTKTGEIADVKPTTEYAVNVRYKATETETGAAFITIVVDETTVDSSENILITTPPSIQGYNYDLSKPVYGNVGAFSKHSIWIAASAGLSSVIVDNSALTAVIGGPDIDLLSSADSYVTALNNAGIDWVYTYDAADDVSTMKINFKAAFLNSLALGEYPIVITAKDANGKTSTATLNVVVTEAKVETAAVDEGEVYSRSAVITGNVLDTEATGFTLQYRAAAARSGEWINAETVVTGDTFTAHLTDLLPGTRYEYRAICDGYEAAAVLSFTTEAETQLPNAGFEDWQTSSSPYLIYASGGSMFWDSGNHGSATMKKNVTVPSSDYWHSGNYSAGLQSQFVGIGSIGKFAAGNIFVGEYLGTDGTDGILGWGRPFTTRPKALRVWVRYVPQTVAYESSYWTGLKKGDQDQGIIYCALLDGTKMYTYNGKSYPVIIKTKSREFFDKNGPNVIAYGEKIFDSEVGTMTQFEIPLDYLRTGVKPSYILLTCAASRGGDYFVGGPSEMYIDDIELVY